MGDCKSKSSVVATVQYYLSGYLVTTGTHMTHPNSLIKYRTLGHSDNCPQGIKQLQGWRTAALGRKTDKKETECNNFNLADF